MKYIENRSVVLQGKARHHAAEAEAVFIDTECAYTTVALFLCGENPWGFHNDLRFSLPVSNVRQGERIMAAAEHTLETDAQYVVLSDEDYELLLSAVSAPRRHPSEVPIPTPLARAILPLLDAIESALNTVEERSKTEPAPGMGAFA